MEETSTTDTLEKKENLFAKLRNLITRTFSGHSRKTWLWITIFLAITVVTVFLFYMQFTDETWLFGIVINYFAIPVLSMGIWGFVVFILFMGIQGILLPLPSELVLLSSGLIWGWQYGWILGIIGSMFAGVITYYISMKGGRPLAEKFVGADNIALIDKYIEKYGGKIILAARAFPFMAFDPISYASGLVKIKTRTYIFATFAGSIIRCLIYALLGNSMILVGKDLSYFIDHPDELSSFISENAALFNTMFLIIIIVVVLFFLIYQYVLLPYLKKKQGSLEMGADNGKENNKNAENSERKGIKSETTATITKKSGGT
ncbi:MAG: TVP38/TMEM64 family protein [Promethearchaeota archaeon]